MWDGVQGVAQQVLVILKASSEIIMLDERKAKLADVRSNGKRGLLWRLDLRFIAGG